MKNLTLGIVAWMQNAVARGEEGDVTWPGGLLGAILVVLLILCAIVFLWINIDINKR